VENKRYSEQLAKDAEIEGMLKDKTDSKQVETILDKKL